MYALKANYPYGWFYFLKKLNYHLAYWYGCLPAPVEVRRPLAKHLRDVFEYTLPAVEIYQYE